MYTLGVDPQPTCLGICVKEYGKDEPIVWRVEYFKRKSLFKKSEDWQKYLHKKCKIILIQIIEHELGGSKDLVLVIEQQRGRVNSLVENTLCCIGCDMVGMDGVRLVHPNTWRKTLPVDHEKGECGHYSNKKSTIRLTKQNDLLRPIVESRKLSTLRLADMCDAYWICKWYESQ